MHPAFRRMPLPSIGTVHSALLSYVVIASAATWQSPGTQALNFRRLLRCARNDKRYGGTYHEDPKNSRCSLLSRPGVDFSAYLHPKRLGGFEKVSGRRSH
jgi:hypothetical protein